MAAPNDILSGTAGIAGPPSPNSAWNDLLSDITAIQLPVDYTSNPAERIGVDHICIEEGDCTDFCDPQPSCYWKHEWQCEHAKKEEWYGNLTHMLDTSIDTFSSKHLCICDVLNDCCPDLCDIAEQEFLALLLNVASGQVALGCGVVECNDCFYSVAEILEIVDDLLSHSSRSDYDCSKALQYLTGINQDEILCDSPNNSDECKQTERCRLNNGVCVKKQDCTATSLGGAVDCIDGWCEGNDCTCLVEKSTSLPSSSPVASPSRSPTTPSNQPTASPMSPVPPVSPISPTSPIAPTSPTAPVATQQPVFYQCPSTERCTRNGGGCTRDCIVIPGVVDCDPDLCDGVDCYCRKPATQTTSCLQTRQCAARQGDCVSLFDCVPSSTVDCIDELCYSATGASQEKCTCMIVEDKPECKQVDVCQTKNGKCTRDCEPIPGVLQCSDDCDSTDGCRCKNCIQNDDKCLQQGGRCLLQEVCKELAGLDPDRCDETLCGDPDSDCACFLPTPPCPLTEKCKDVNGACMPTEQCEKWLGQSSPNELQCTNLCSETAVVPNPDCLCLQCNKSFQCEAVGGTCVPFCVANPGEVCDRNLCGSAVDGPCACKYKRDITFDPDVPTTDTPKKTLPGNLP